MGREVFQDKCYNLNRSCSGGEHGGAGDLDGRHPGRLQRVLGSHGFPSSQTHYPQFFVTNGMDRCLQFVIKVFRHPCSQLRPLEKVLQAPKSAQVSLKRMTQRISTSSGYHVPRPLLHILSRPHLGQQVGARILCL